MPQCTATKRDGHGCTLPAIGDSELCWAPPCPEHAARRRRQASRAGRRGGRGRPGVEVREIKDKLRELADNVLDGNVDKGVAAVASQVYGTYLRALKIELDIKEQAELIGRLEELKRLLDAKEAKRWGT